MNCGILDAMEQNKNIISLEESNIDNNVSPVQIIFDTTFNKNANNQEFDNTCKKIEKALSKIFEFYHPKKIIKLKKIKKSKKINSNTKFLGKKNNNIGDIIGINNKGDIINLDYNNININEKYTIEEITNKLDADKQFIRNITGIQQNVMSYNDLIKKFCVKNKDGKYVLYRDIMNSLYNCNTLENYKLSYKEVYNTFKECLIRPEVSVKNIIDFIKNDEDNHNLFQRAEVHFYLSKDKIMHIYKTLGITEDESNCELIKRLESGNHYACRTEDHNILVRDKIARCIRYNDILVDDVLNYLDDPNHTIENAAIDLNKFEEDIRSIYYKYGIVKSENNKYYSCSGIIKNSCEILEEAKEKYGLPLETLDRIFRCNTIKNKQGRVIFLNEVFNYLDNNPNVTLQNVANHFNINKETIAYNYVQYGLIKSPNSNNEYYACHEILDFLIHSNIAMTAKKFNLPIEIINRLACCDKISYYIEQDSDTYDNDLVDNILSDLDNPNSIINSIYDKYNGISKEEIKDLYIDLGITKDNNGKYHCNSDILNAIKKNGSINNTMQQAKFQNIPIERLNKIARCIDFTTDNSNYVAVASNIQTRELLIDDILNYLGNNPNNEMITKASKHFWINRKKIKNIYSKFGITKDNSGMWHCNN